MLPPFKLTLPRGIGVEIDGQVRSSQGNSADAATDHFSIIQFYLAGMAGAHQAASRNRYTRARSDLQQRFTGLSLDRDIVG